MRVKSPIQKVTTRPQYLPRRQVHASGIQRTFVFGDVQAEAKMLDILLDRISPDSQTRLVFVGDLVGRGADSKGVVDRIKNLQHPKIVVAGNHDQWFFRYAQARSDLAQGVLGAEKRLSAMKVTSERAGIFPTLTPEDFTWLGQLPLVDWFTCGEKEFVVVHAGFSPTLNVAGPRFDPQGLPAFQKNRLTHLRFYDEKTLKSIELGKERKFPNRRYWAYTYDGRYGFALFGHHVHFKVAQYSHALALDTGAGVHEPSASLSCVEINQEGAFKRVISVAAVGHTVVESQPAPAADTLLKFFFPTGDQ